MSPSFLRNGSKEKVGIVIVSYGVEEDVSRRLAGIVSLDHFGGGTAALAVLHKPEKPGSECWIQPGCRIGVYR